MLWPVRLTPAPVDPVNVGQSTDKGVSLAEYSLSTSSTLTPLRPRGCQCTESAWGTCSPSHLGILFVTSPLRLKARHLHWPLLSSLAMIYSFSDKLLLVTWITDLYCWTAQSLGPYPLWGFPGHTGMALTWTHEQSLDKLVWLPWWKISTKTTRYAFLCGVFKDS